MGNINWTQTLTVAGTLVTTILCGKGCITAEEGASLTTTGVAFGVAGVTFVTAIIGVVKAHKKGE